MRRNAVGWPSDYNYPVREAKVSTEIELIEFQPGRRLIAFGGVPVGEFVKGLTVIALGVHRCARLGLQVLQNDNPRPSVSMISVALLGTFVR